MEEETPWIQTEHLTFHNACEFALGDLRKEEASRFGLGAKEDQMMQQRTYEGQFLQMKHGIYQYYMRVLVDSYHSAQRYAINNMGEDILQALGVSIRFAGQLPSWTTVDRAFSGYPDVHVLLEFLVQLFAENWTECLALSFEKHQKRSSGQNVFASFLMSRTTLFAAEETL